MSTHNYSVAIIVHDVEELRYIVQMLMLFVRLFTNISVLQFYLIDKILIRDLTVKILLTFLKVFFD